MYTKLLDYWEFLMGEVTKLPGNSYMLWKLYGKSVQTYRLLYYCLLLICSALEFFCTLGVNATLVVFAIIPTNYVLFNPFTSYKIGFPPWSLYICSNYFQQCFYIYQIIFNIDISSTVDHYFHDIRSTFTYCFVKNWNSLHMKRSF